MLPPKQQFLVKNDTTDRVLRHCPDPGTLAIRNPFISSTTYLSSCRQKHLTTFELADRLEAGLNEGETPKMASLHGASSCGEVVVVEVPDSERGADRLKATAYLHTPTPPLFVTIFSFPIYNHPISGRKKGTVTGNSNPAWACPFDIGTHQHLFPKTLLPNQGVNFEKHDSSYAIIPGLLNLL